MSFTGEARFVSDLKAVYDLEGVTDLAQLHTHATLLAAVGIPAKVVIAAGNNPQTNVTEPQISHLT